MTEEQLDEIEQRLLTSSAGSRNYGNPVWEVSNSDGPGFLVAAMGSSCDGKDWYVVTRGVHASELRGGSEEDARFVANAPADIEALLAEVRMLRRAMDDAADRINDFLMRSDM